MSRPGRFAGVLVVGGGYSGLHAVRAVEGLGIAATVIDRTGDHDFVTRLAAVAGGSASKVDARQPLGRFVRTVEVGSVVLVEDGAVELADGRRIEADAVVVTSGADCSRPAIEGIEHAAGLRTADDAFSLRTAIAATTSVVIIGAGATGVQLAGAIAHTHPDILVHLVEVEARLLAGLPTALGRGAERILGERGVELHLGRPVDRIDPDGVHVDGSFIEGHVVWAGGFVADAARLGVPTTNDGRIAIDADLRISGMQRTFAAGDVAGHTDRHGHALPMSAQIAAQAGTVAGRNAARLVRDEPTEPAALQQRGWVLDLTGGRGLAQFGPLVLASPVLDLMPPLMHHAIDLKDLIEIGGLGALRFAPTPVRELMTHLAWPIWSARPDVALDPLVIAAGLKRVLAECFTLSDDRVDTATPLLA
jgi:NADH dehydrogenase FAD-containing subunit